MINKMLCLYWYSFFRPSDYMKGYVDRQIPIYKNRAFSKLVVRI